MVRFKNRWLLVDVTFQSGSSSGSGSVSDGDAASSLSAHPSSTLTLLRTIRASLQDNFGDVASGALGGSIAIKYYSPSTRTAIIRCSRVGVKEVWGALTLCNEWEGKEVRLVTLHCGGESFNDENREGFSLSIDNTLRILGTIRKVQEAAIRINRKRIQTLYQEKKRISSQSSRPSLFKGEEQEKKEGDEITVQMDMEAISAIEQDTKIINAIQQ